MNNDNIHRWLDGSKVADGFTNWRSGDPTNGNQNHMDIMMHSNGVWTDYLGTTSYKYICESGLI